MQKLLFVISIICLSFTCYGGTPITAHRDKHLQVGRGYLEGTRGRVEVNRRGKVEALLLIVVLALKS